MVGRPNNALTPLKIRSLNTQGKYADGDGLYLQVSRGGSKSWIYRYQLNGRRREMGLGSLTDTTLAQARDELRKHRGTVKSKKDPKLLRDANEREMSDRQQWTFDKCADAYIESHAPSWKNAKHAQQWRNTLNTYASPVFGKLPIEEIDRALVMRVIEPIWLTKTETASRVRSRLENILSWAIVKGLRDNPNPAVWRGNLSQLLPQPSKVAKTQHHKALPYKEMSVFMAELSKRDNISALALRFIILTASRTNEVIAASWDEINLIDRVWTIPADRMKSKREHRIPLSDHVIALLDDMPKLDGWLFPSVQLGKHMSNMAMLKFLQENMRRADLTVHGFRSTFRDWAAEISTYPRELAEASLAHVLSDKTEAAYQRGDLLEKRREMMQAWADYAMKMDREVVPIRNSK